MKIYFKPWKKFASFEGRASRKEYWVFVIINIIILLFTPAIGKGIIPREFFYLFNEQDPGLLLFIFYLISLFPSIGVGIRRLHDINKSGWWLLLSLVPILGWIALFVMTVLPGTYEQNDFGVDPKHDVIHW